MYKVHQVLYTEHLAMYKYGNKIILQMFILISDAVFLEKI